MKTKSIKGKSPEAFKTALTNNLTDDHIAVKGGHIY